MYPIIEAMARYTAQTAVTYPAARLPSSAQLREHHQENHQHPARPPPSSSATWPGTPPGGGGGRGAGVDAAPVRPVNFHWRGGRVASCGGCAASRAATVSGSCSVTQ